VIFFVFGGAGKWWDDWELCGHCNTLVHKGAMHVCDETAHLAKRLEEFLGEWDEIRWVAFDEWIATPEGQFEIYYIHRAA
jgi:hypothetical protein